MHTQQIHLESRTRLSSSLRRFKTSQQLGEEIRDLGTVFQPQQVPPMGQVALVTRAARANYASEMITQAFNSTKKLPMLWAIPETVAISFECCWVS